MFYSLLQALKKNASRPFFLFNYLTLKVALK